MTALSAIDLYWLERRLEIATEEVRRITPEMSADELRDALKGMPGSEGLTIGYAPNGNQLVTMDGKTIEVGPMASNGEILAALQNPFVPTRNTQLMSITGIQSGAFQAKLAEMRQKMADQQAQALAKIDGAVAAGGAQLHAATDGAVAKVNSEVADALHEFGLTTNGGPA